MSNSGSDNEAKSYEEDKTFEEIRRRELAEKQRREFAEDQRRKREDEEIINEYLTAVRNGAFRYPGRGVIDHRRLIRERDGKDDSNRTASDHRRSRMGSLHEQEMNGFKFDESIVHLVAWRLSRMKEGDYDTDVDYEDTDYEEEEGEEEEEEEEDDDQD